MKIIVAYDENGCIGKDGQLPWYIPEDLKWFKERTENQVVIMGRKTFESIPNAPLKNRFNIVLTRDKEYTLDAPDTFIANDEVDVTKLLIEFQYKFDDIYVIGGSSIFEYLIPYVREIYATEVETVVKGDRFFNIPNLYEWNREVIKESSNDEFDYTFVKYTRLNNFMIDEII